MFCEISKFAGFCFGVSEAVNSVFELKNKENVYVLGEIVHNEAVIKKIKDAKIKIVQNYNEIPNGATAIIRAHGVGKSVIYDLNKRNIKIIDKTCPNVKKIHKIVQNNDKQTIIIGAKNHPEVIGITGWCRDSIVIDEKNYDFFEFKQSAIVVVQTTFGMENFGKICKFLIKKVQDIKIFDTICMNVKLRIKELNERSFNMDLIIVVGSKNSSNSLKLFKTAQNLCKAAILIDRANELDTKILKPNSKIFITSGSSTMKETVMEVHDLIHQLKNSLY
jgi:4-hydroxy-3-methylbut-2-enyl diphosphate reductase